MTDQTVGGASAAAPLIRGRSGLAQIERRTALVIVAALAAVVGVYFWYTEGTIENVTFTIGITAALVALLTLATRRLLFSTVAVASFVAILSVAAHVKRLTMNMVVHAYDFFFYLSSWSTLNFLITEYPGMIAKALGALALFGALLWYVWRIDGTRLARKNAFIAFVVAFAAGTFGWATKGERRHMQFFFENLYVSSFYASWGETVGTLWHGTILEAAPRSSVAAAPLQIPQQCSPKTKPPHIILIHQESIVPPNILPGLGYDKALDPMFKSQDGRQHTLRVETYGGASWLTEFSVLAGVSTQAFGGMRQFVQTFTVNRLSDTVPQRLAQCGYQNVVVYPMMRNFVSNDKFYTSIGLKEIIDMGAMGAKTAQERDKFYYGFALNRMSKHYGESDKPLFTYIQTMSAHWPYDFTYEPEEKVAGGTPGTHPEMSEYLRRLALAKRDYDGFLTDLKAKFPGERFLIVHYGDHHPSSTRSYIGLKEDQDVEDITSAIMKEDSLGYLTYFAFDGHNYRVPDVLAGVKPGTPVDVPYLGMLLQAAAGLPLSDANAERRRLMVECQGRYNTCADRSKILAFHRRLIDGGILVAR